MNIIDRGSTSHDTRTRQGKSEVFMVVELETNDFNDFLGFCIRHNILLKELDLMGIKVREKKE